MPFNKSVASEQKYNIEYVQNSYQEVDVLWKELKALRYTPDFHANGFALCCKSGQWNVRRKELLEKWRKFQSTIPLKNQFNSDSEEVYPLTKALLNMKYIGRDWYRNTGKNTKKDTGKLILEVDTILSVFKS